MERIIFEEDQIRRYLEWLKNPEGVYYRVCFLTTEGKFEGDLPFVMDKQMEQDQIKCNECRFFDRFPQGQTELGYCRESSPVIIQGLGNKKGNYPIVSIDDWCGVAERKENNHG